VDLSIDTRVLFWSGIVLGTLSIGILGYAVVRYILQRNQLGGYFILLVTIAISDVYFSSYFHQQNI